MDYFEKLVEGVVVEFSIHIIFFSLAFDKQKERKEFLSPSQDGKVKVLIFHPINHVNNI